MPLSPPTCPDADPTCQETDMDDSGVVGISDFVAYVAEFGTAPGPSLNPAADTERCFR